MSRVRQPAPPRSALGRLASLLRPLHWIKNAVVLAPVVFAGRLTDPAAVTLSLATALAFCLLASAGYVLNDLHDAAHDRHHPDKRSRPLAAGTVEPATALALALTCLVLGLGLAYRVQQAAPPPPGATGLLALGTFRWCALYVALGALYTAFLKKLIVIDVLALGAAFVLRAFAGAAALQLLPSRWLIACGYCLALFLAFGKRRLEVVQLGPQTQASRPMAARYTLGLLDPLVDGAAVLVSVIWVAYCVAPDTVRRVDGYGLLLTAPIVIALVHRHRGQLRRGRGSDPVELLARDRLALGGFLLWTSVVLGVIYRPW